MCKRFCRSMMWVIAWMCWTLSLLGLASGEKAARVMTVKTGSDVILNCDTADNNKPFELLNWNLNNSKSHIFAKFMDLQPYIAKRFSRRLHIFNNSAILVSHVSPSDAGIYRCKTMSSSSGANPATIKHGTPIKLVVEGSTLPPPSHRKTIKEGFPVLLDCSLDSSAPNNNLQYSWTKDGKNVMSPPKSGMNILVVGSLFIKTTKRTDSGVYKCTARTLDSTGTKILTYSGTDVFLDVQYVPSIILIEAVASASQGSEVLLPCVSQANPGTITTSWSRGSTNLNKKGPRYAVLQEGSLLIRSLKTSDAGTYTCTPSNAVGKGASKSTRLVVKIVPRFTEVPPAVKTVRLGDDISLVCSAVSDVSASVKVTWIRIGVSLPPGRTTLNGGKLTIANVQRSDDGQYMCLASAAEGVAKHSTTITVLATPGAPNITNMVVTGSSVTITWTPGLDGGFPQKFEIWYRKSTDTDSQWKRTNLLPTGSNSFTLKNSDSTYLFAVRGVNSEGAGDFSSVQGISVPTYLRDKPLPPTNVIINITSDGYYVSWKHVEVPGRPVVNTFVLEYRENNTSNAWIRVEESVDGDKRVHLLKASLFEPDAVYEFRVYAFGNKLSEPAYASKTYVIATPVVPDKKKKNDYIPIVAGVLGAIVFIVLFGLVCFCVVQYSSRKKSGDRSNKKVQFLLPDGKSKSQAAESLDDYNDEEIKLRPEAVRFVPDKNFSVGNHWRRKIQHDEDFFLLSSCDHVFGGDKLECVAGPRRLTLESPHVTSPKDKVKFFGEPEENGWYDCTLGRAASNEVRDSYDQFCRSPSDIGSRDSLDRDALKRALYEHTGSKLQLVRKFDGSNSSLQNEKGKPMRGPRFRTPPPPVNEDAALVRSKNHPHHWSLPAVYSHSGNIHNNRDSDSDSVSSVGRRRRRMNRPSSYYEGCVSLQPDLVPITEQESDTNIRCSCEEDEPEQNTKNTDLGRGSESSYLHLERNDSLKQPYLNRMKSWDEESDGSVGKPYGPHPKLTDDEALQSIDSTSENSVSPAHSLASLTDSEVDGEINRHIMNDTLDSKRLSQGRNNILGIPYMKHLDADTASDISEKDDFKNKVINEQAILPPRYELPRAVTNLRTDLHADSLDQLKVCDPYYQRKRNSVSRSPSNASSGIYSVQVSSSETNSVDSPIVSRRQSKGSARSSATSSGFSESMSTRGSLGSEGPYFDSSRTNSLRNSPKHRFPHLEEPYEWDREGTGSEFESGSEVGHTYKPNMIANMHHLLELQQRLGIDLESSSSSESLANKDKLEKLTIPEMMNYEPAVSPSTYEVDNYSTEEKDKRCSKLMDEFKANRKVQDEKLNGSMIYHTWDL